jgi:hypothetical protein
VLDEAIGQGGLAVIDVGDDAKVAGLAHGPPVREQAAKRRLDLAPAPSPLPSSSGQRELNPLNSSGLIRPQDFSPWGSGGLDCGGELIMYPNLARKSIRVTAQECSLYSKSKAWSSGPVHAPASRGSEFNGFAGLKD